MNKKLIQKLVDKYPSLFEEMRASKERMAKHNEFMNQIHKIRDQQLKETDESKRLELEEQIKTIHEQQSKVEPYWSIAFGFECDDGWYDLLDKLMENIMKLDVNKQVRIHQVKEKLGGLKFYTGGTPLRMDILGVQSIEVGESGDGKEIHELIQEAEDASYTICEVCGKPGKCCVNEHKWLKTVCMEHRNLKRWDDRTDHFVPCSRFYIEQKVITPEKTIQEVVEKTLRPDDEYEYKLNNDKVYLEKDLAFIPHSNFFKNQIITKDDSLSGWVIQDKNFDPIAGWQYILIPENSELKTDPVTAREEELTEVLIEDENGYKRYKTLK